jgi:hypothetical protein
LLFSAARLEFSPEPNAALQGGVRPYQRRPEPDCVVLNGSFPIGGDVMPDVLDPPHQILRVRVVIFILVGAWMLALASASPSSAQSLPPDGA